MVTGGGPEIAPFERADSLMKESSRGSSSLPGVLLSSLYSADINYNNYKDSNGERICFLLKKIWRRSPSGALLMDQISK